MFNVSLEFSIYNCFNLCWGSKLVKPTNSKLGLVPFHGFLGKPQEFANKVAWQLCILGKPQGYIEQKWLRRLDVTHKNLHGH